MLLKLSVGLRTFICNGIDAPQHYFVDLVARLGSWAESHLLFWQSKIITVTAFAQDLPKLVKTSLQGTATTPHTARCVARALLEAAETAAVPQPHTSLQQARRGVTTKTPQ